ncbi:MAG TPA: TetR family transcriptional regulator [Pseudomonadales bacterium]
MPSKHNTRLSRERIIEQGLQLASQHGVANITLRKLATRLDVTPMALYRHFANKDELLGEMLDAFIVRARVIPEQPMDWQDWLLAVGNNMFEALKQEPSWIPVFPHIRLKPAALHVLQQCSDQLISAGFTRTQALEGFVTVIHCLLGAVAMHSDDNDGIAFARSLQIIIAGMEEQRPLHGE